MTRKMVTLLLAYVTALLEALTGLLLVMVNCVIRRPAWLRWLWRTIFQPGDTVMQRTMLRGTPVPAEST